MSEILEVQSLVKKFKSGKKDLIVIDNISFSVEESSSVAIVGPSGSGKTTLLGLCAGLDTPTEGIIFRRSSSLAGRLSAPPA